MLEDSDEFFEKYKPAVPKPWYADGSMSNDDDEDISWKLDTPWDTIAHPITKHNGTEERGANKWNDFIWTVCHVDDATYICQGFQFVNRAFYLMATVPYQEGDKDTYCYMASSDDEMYPTIGEAMLEVEGLVNAEVSSLKKSNQEGDIEMAELLDNSIKVIKGHFNEVS